MHPVLEDLIGLLRLERIEDNIFRGDSRDIGSPQVFGGQSLDRHYRRLKIPLTIASLIPCMPIFCDAVTLTRR